MGTVVLPKWPLNMGRGFLDLSGILPFKPKVRTPGEKYIQISTNVPGISPVAYENNFCDLEEI